MSDKKFYTDSKHEYFFIRNGAIYEVFKTFRGNRVRHRLELENVEDCDKLTDTQVKEIELKFLK